MENIEERLRRLEAADCKVCGFTVDNADPGFQDRFIALLPEAKNLEILALTRLLPLNEIEDEWRRGQAENYRREKKIADSPERAAYFLCADAAPAPEYPACASRSAGTLPF